MVYVAADTFEMGEPWTEARDDELPVHTVTLSAYEIGKYEVTNREYAGVMNWANARGYLQNSAGDAYIGGDVYAYGQLLVESDGLQIAFVDGRFLDTIRDGYSMADHPVINVSWYGAAVYCNWLSQSMDLQPCYDTSTWGCDFSKNGYRLPTEAEWEHAAAWDGSSHWRYGFPGDIFDCSRSNGWVEGASCNPLGLSERPFTTPFGYYNGLNGTIDGPSPNGCWDMSGNVWEWCNDWYEADYYSSSPSIDPSGPTTGEGRVHRGGSWLDDYWYCRSAVRESHAPWSAQNDDLGFRVARTPQTWQATYGGAGEDVATAICQTADGGFLLAGWTNSWGAGAQDVYLVHTDAHGNLLWQTTQGGESNDVGTSVCQAMDGTYVVCGYTYSFGAGDSDAYLTAAACDGSVVWQKTYGGESQDSANWVEQTSDGGYILVGSSSSSGTGNRDVYLVKVDAQGEALWQSTYGGESDDYGRCVEQTGDGGYVLAGYTLSFGSGSFDVYLIKTDAQGNLLWHSTYGGQDSDMAYCVRETRDGGYILGGRTKSFGGALSSIYLIKADSQGDLVWQKTLSPYPEDHWCYGVIETGDEGYALTGNMENQDGSNHDMFLIKTDGQGEMLWIRTYGKFGELSYDSAFGLEETDDGGFILAGETTSFGDEQGAAYVVKTDAYGNSPYPPPE